VTQEQPGAEGAGTADALAEVTHETRRPLGLARSYLSLILEEHVGPLTGTLRERLEQVDAKLAEALSALDNRLLLLSTLERNERQPTLQQPVDLVAAVEGAINRAQVRCELAAGRLDFQHSPPPIRARANSLLLDRVLDNLLENALIYSAGPPQVTVEVGLGSPGRPFVRVVDQGVGMTRAVAAEIFERGFRGDPANPSSGSGLGLWLSRRAAAQMEARLVLEATEPGRGSAFLLELQPDGDAGG
jgi:signal transduction histidine kinase